MTNLDDAQHASEAGAWAVGCILWEGSKRRCELPEFEAIARSLRRITEVVGVFVDHPLDELCDLVDAIRPSMVQLHGDEGPIYADEVARRTGVTVIKAARVRSNADVQALAAFRRAGFHLLDAHVEGMPGGTGQTWDWGIVQRRISRVPILVSGGLNPGNVGDAMAQLRPWGVDVAGGTEASPGVKDREKVEAFLEAVRLKDEELAPLPEPEHVYDEQTEEQRA